MSEDLWKNMDLLTKNQFYINPLYPYYEKLSSNWYIFDTNFLDISSSFQRYEQEDAHEFLQCLLDKLDSNWLKYEAVAIDASTSDNSSFSDHTLVKQIFGGRLVSQVATSLCPLNVSDSLLTLCMSNSKIIIFLKFRFIAVNVVIILIL